MAEAEDGLDFRAMSGSYRGSGSPWAICSAKILRWSRRTRSIVASTSLSSTNRRCSRICVGAGGICSAPDVLLYDLTSTYFESGPPSDDSDKRRHGYSRDKRSDCVRVVIALIVTPDGFPLAYEVLPGNTSPQEAQTVGVDDVRASEAADGLSGTFWTDAGTPGDRAKEAAAGV